MSHSIQFSASAELQDRFVSAQSTKEVRLLKVRIINESFQLVMDVTRVEGEPIRDQFASTLENVVGNPPNEAAFVLFFDYECSGKWILIRFIPDSCPVRDRMLYASSSNELKTSLSAAVFAGDFQCSTVSELVYDDVVRQTKNKNVGDSDAQEFDLRTTKEKILAEEKSLPVAPSVSSAYVHGVGIRFSDQVDSTLAALRNGQVNVVVLVVDTAREEVAVRDHQQPVGQAAIPLDHARSLVDPAQPSFAVVRLDVSAYAGVAETIVLLYSAPVGSSIRARTISSMALGSVVDRVKSSGIALTKKIETSDPADLTVEFLETNLGIGATDGSSSSMGKRAAFKKPAKPGRSASKM